MPLKIIVFAVLMISTLIINFDMPKKVIDQIQMVTVVGYDYIDEEMLQGTVITPFYQQQNTVQNLIYTGQASSIYENREKLNAQASEELYNGKIEVAFFNDEFARHGLKKVIDYMLRDPSIGSRIFLAVAKGSSNELLTNVSSQKEAGIFLADLIEHNIRNGNLPLTNLKQFNHGVEGKTIDPFLPMLSLEDGQPSLTALAFFQDDKLVDTLPYEEAFRFKMLYENIGDGQYNFENDEYRISVHNIESKRDIKVQKLNGDPQVTFDIRFTGVVREYTGKNLTKDLKKVEKDLEENFKKNANKLIKRFKELKIDPLGIEEQVKAQMRSYNNKKFQDQYRDLPVKIKIKFKITETGTRR
ncbi:Ger(x)C family spore germination protein [Virgibacillus kekensis]|uniref:Ger(X)C family spore germination protein n=1 Tax=Virgibacillus kekensis TaxID=202261 RepID=A0ABV9DDJ9_9BACI